MKKRTRFKNKELTRVLLLSLLLLGLSKPGNAQFDYGIKLGAGAACQSDLLDIANNCDLKFSPSFGLVGKYHFKNGIALKSGLEYVQKGRRIEENASLINDKLHYLNIPVKAEFSAGEKAGFKNDQRVYFAMGPYFSYLLDANSIGDEQQYRFKDLTKDYDFGFCVDNKIQTQIQN